VTSKWVGKDFVKMSALARGGQISTDSTPIYSAGRKSR
jgi:hypothetical protein